jgi:uncharacterized membrane protein YdjX (TVP38/TMEM64 family)
MPDTHKPQPQAPTPPNSLGLTFVRVGALIFVIAITVYIYYVRDRADELARYGYPGIFLLSILANATIILPAPGLAIVFAAGGVFAPFGVGLAAGAGATLGELSGYLAGFSGQAVIEQRGVYNRIESWMKRYGPATIMALAFIPSPLFDLAGVAAGALKMPVHKFLLWCALGKIPKMLVFAYAGAYSVDWLVRWIK